MLVRVSGRESAKPGGTAGSNYPVPAEMQGQVFYLQKYSHCEESSDKWLRFPRRNPWLLLGMTIRLEEI